MSFNVLVVDDSAVMRTMILQTLNLTGIPLGEVHQAANGREALEVLEDNWVDLAFVDINMPVMDGEELIGRIRANPLTRDLSIVVVSTESSERRIEKLREQGARFIHKPFPVELLREVILDVTGVDDDRAAAKGAPGRRGPDF